MTTALTSYDKEREEERISRKQFVKLCAAGLMALAGAYILKEFPKRNKTDNSYGNENYGGC